MLFYRRIKSARSLVLALDSQVERAYNSRMRSLAKSFLAALFKDSDLIGAQEAARSLIGSARTSDYAITVEFVGESLRNRGIGGVANGAKAAFPDIELLSLMHLAEKKMASGERPKAVARAFEWVLDRSLKMGLTSASVTMEWMQTALASSPQATKEAVIFMAQGMVEGKFLRMLYVAKSEDDLVKACRHARSAISLASKMGEQAHSAAVDRIDAACDSFCDSRQLREMGLEPEEARKLFEAGIPDFVFHSKNHAYFASQRRKITQSMIEKDYGQAIMHAQGGLDKARSLSRKATAYEFELEILHCRLHECLFKREEANAIAGAIGKLLPEGDLQKRLFKPEKLQEAIQVTRQILDLTGKNSAPLPTFVRECFFIFAYSKDRVMRIQPGEVRRAVLRGIPDFPSNHAKVMERLEAEMEGKLKRIVAEGTMNELSPPASLALEIIELSFLSPTSTYSAKRRMVRSLFDRFVIEYSQRHGEKMAKDDGYLKDAVRREISQRIPDIYSESAA